MHPVVRVLKEELAKTYKSSQDYSPNKTFFYRSTLVNSEGWYLPKLAIALKVTIFKSGKDDKIEITFFVSWFTKPENEKHLVRFEQFLPTPNTRPWFAAWIVYAIS